MALAAPLFNNCSHLAINAITHLMLFLLGPDRESALPVISQHLLCKFYPDPPSRHSYPGLNKCCRNLLIEAYMATTPNSSRYEYHPSLKTHRFMSLKMFDASQLHQMRSGQSYL